MLVIGSGLLDEHKVDVNSLVRVKPSERQIAWQELGFTAFLHFGMNTFTGLEWGSGKENPSLYNPTRLDTDQWCSALKSAGIRACVLTAKHHDGFCLFKTKYTKYSVMASPCPVDVVEMLSASCVKYGLKLGLYLSPWDKHEPLYGSGKKYNDFFCGQLEEILTHYGKLYSVWLDGVCDESPYGKKQLFDWDRYYALIRKHQPEAVIASVGPDVRWTSSDSGETRPPEWSVVPAWTRDIHKIAVGLRQPNNISLPDFGSREKMAGQTDLVWYPAEVNVSIRPGWFYHAEEDDQVKSLETLLHYYETAAGGNAVLMLNIPPNREGRIHHTDCKRLAELGKTLGNTYFINYLAEGASVRTITDDPAHPAVNILRNDDSYWKPYSKTGQAAIEITLPAEKKITHLDLREYIRDSQRIESFSIFAQTSAGWKKIYFGTTVGFRKICRFDPIITGKLQIIIDQSRVYPTLRYVGAHLEE